MFFKLNKFPNYPQISSYKRLSHFLTPLKFHNNWMGLFWREEGCTMKYSLSSKEIPRAKREGFPENLGYILWYISNWVTIKPFSITTPALSFLEINIGRVDIPYCSDNSAIRDSPGYTGSINDAHLFLDNYVSHWREEEKYTLEFW